MNPLWQLTRLRCVGLLAKVWGYRGLAEDVKKKNVFAFNKTKPLLFGKINKSKLLLFYCFGTSFAKGTQEIQGNLPGVCGLCS